MNIKKKPRHDVGPGLGQAQKCVGVKPVNGIPTLHLLIWILNGNNLLSSERTFVLGDKKCNFRIYC